MIVKILDKYTSLGEKIWTLSKDQGITFALLPGGGGGGTKMGGEPPPKDEKGLKEWLRNKLKALALLLGK